LHLQAKLSIFLLAFDVCITIFLNDFFGQGNLIHRTTLFLYPLLIWHIFNGWQPILNYRPTKFIWLCAGWVIGISFFANALINLQVKEFKYCTYDALSINMFKAIEKEIKNSHETPISLGISWEFELVINYYIRKDYANKINEVNRDGVKQEHTYLYLKQEDLIKNYPIAADTIWMDSTSKEVYFLLRRN